MRDRSFRAGVFRLRGTTDDGGAGEVAHIVVRAHVRLAVGIGRTAVRPYFGEKR